MSDLEAIARAVDPRAVRSGDSYKFRCPVHEDANPSASMRFEGERLLVHCFAGCSNAAVFEAVRARAGALLPAGRPPNGAERPQTPSRAVARVSAPAAVPEAALPPGDAPEPDFPRLAPSRARFASAWAYRLPGGALAFWVARYDTADGKTIRPFVWREGRWQPGAFPAPRPLYNLPRLSTPGVVLLVEGEKAAEAAQNAIPVIPVLTWPGGAQGYRKADWAPLAGRKVAIWPDNDEVGRDVAEILEGLDCKVRFVASRQDAPLGWDAADAVDEGIDLGLYVRSNLLDALPSGMVSNHALAEVVGEEVSAAVAEAEADLAPPTIGGVAGLPISLNSTGTTAENSERNARLLIGLFVQQGALELWTDELSGAQMIRWDRDKPRYVRWDEDPTELTVRIQNLDLPYRKFDRRRVEDVMRLMFSHNKRDPIVEWFEALPQWDGTERFDTLLQEGLGVMSNIDFALIAMRNHFVATVARQYRPGAKYDHAIILEGSQGVGKSTVIQMLSPAGSFDTVAHAQFGTRDFYDLLHRHVFIELAELSAISRSDLEAVKADIAKPRDIYRPAWGRSVVERDRRCLFWGSTNLGEYLHDTTGARRFWPITVGRVDFAWIKANAAQLWAEALVGYRAGERFWLMPADMAASEQERRRVMHPWEAELERRIRMHPPERGVNSSWLMRGEPLSRMTVPEAFDLLEVPVHQRGRAQQMQLAAAFQSIGWMKGRRSGSNRTYVGPGDPEYEVKQTFRASMDNWNAEVVRP
jgi:putative DNA primase/helicase